MTTSLTSGLDKGATLYPSATITEGSPRRLADGIRSSILPCGEALAVASIAPITGSTRLGSRSGDWDLPRFAKATFVTVGFANQVVIARALHDPVRVEIWNPVMKSWGRQDIWKSLSGRGTQNRCWKKWSQISPDSTKMNFPPRTSPATASARCQQKPGPSRTRKFLRRHMSICRNLPVFGRAS